MKLSTLIPTLGLVFLGTFGHLANGQSPCGVAPVSRVDAQPNIFSPQQEEWLGEAMADVIEQDYRPVHDPSQSAYLQTIVDKLIATLPSTGMRFRITLVDSSAINGYSLAGGRIYLTRKLAAAAHNDDELAAVMGHEMGHIASHQFAFETTADLKRLLGVTQVGDRADIYDKFQKLMDARMKDKHPAKGGDADEGQGEADKVGVYVTAAAGYRPQALAEFWDRAFFVGGKTGSRLSDFFGVTKPTEKRLRGMNILAAALPKGCGAAEDHLTAQFTTWHAAVVANQIAANEGDLAAKTVQLTPPLRLDVDRLRFSRDGERALAQDAGSIFVLTKDPLAVEFRIDAENALSAEFSPDSSKIVFTTGGMHTEIWDIAEKKLEKAEELVTKMQCSQIKLSPDGRTMVCLYLDEMSPDIHLSLIDVATGGTVFEKRNLFTPNWFALLAFLNNRDDYEDDFVPVHFSPDGNTLLVGAAGTKMAFDLRTRTPIKIAGGLKSDLDGDFAFVANDKVAGFHLEDIRNSGEYSFPDGKRLKKVTMAGTSMGTISHSEQWVLARGVKNSPSALVNIDNGNIVGLATRAVDVWDDLMLAETNNGFLATAKMGAGKSTIVGTVALPLSPLAFSRSVSISPDGKYLALSTRFHGGIWDLDSGQRRANLRGFTNAQWGTGDVFFADTPKRGSVERHMVKVTMTPPAYKDMAYTVNDDKHLRYGYLVEWKSGEKKSSDLIVHNPEDDAVLWKRTFAGGAATYTVNAGGGDLIFNYKLQDQPARDRLKVSPMLANEVASLKQKDLGRLIEVADGSSGKTLAEVVLELPLRFSGTDGLNRLDDVLYVSSEDNRTMLYSLTNGRQIKQLFGYLTTLDVASRRICLVNRRDEAVVYDADGNELAHFHLGSPLRFARFSEKGTKLMVLTADQKVRTMDVAKKAVAGK